MTRRERRKLERPKGRRIELKRRNFSRRRRRMGILLIIIAVALAVWVVNAKREITLEMARENPDLRTAYTEKIVSKIGLPPYVAAVIYAAPDKLEEILKRHAVGEDEVMVTEVHAENPLGLDFVPANVWIFPLAFRGNPIVKEADFVSALRHEYQHAQNINLRRVEPFTFKDFLNNKGEVNEKLLESANEMDAVRRELPGGDLSASYRDNQIRIYLAHYANIWRQEEGMNPRLIKDLKVQFFQLWMLTSPYLLKGKDGSWSLKDNTGREYPLPKEIAEKFSKGGKG